MVKSFSIACQQTSGENSTGKTQHHVITLTPSFPGCRALISEAVALHHPPKVSHHCTANSSKHERRSGDGHEMWHEIQEGRPEKICRPKNLVGLPFTAVSQGREEQRESQTNIQWSILYFTKFSKIL